jgi:hypothetical protein
VTVLVAFALARGGGDHAAAPKTSGPLPPLVLSAPPSSAAAEAPCAQVLTALPVKLGPLEPRVVHSEPDSPFVVAWGDPAVVLRCGVSRPARLVPDSTDQVFLAGKVYWLPVQNKDATVFTTIDRSVYVEVNIPKRVAYQPLPILGTAIAAKLKAICAVPDSNSGYRPDQLCTHRP